MRSASLRTLVPTLAALLCLLAAAPPALAQVDDNRSVTPTVGPVGEESTLEDSAGVVYYVLIAAMSLVVFVGLLWMTTRYRRQRGERPPP